MIIAGSETPMTQRVPKNPKGCQAPEVGTLCGTLWSRSASPSPQRVPPITGWHPLMALFEVHLYFQQLTQTAKSGTLLALIQLYTPDTAVLRCSLCPLTPGYSSGEGERHGRARVESNLCAKPTGG